ncbi:hypothetical protein [Curtobacterium sp. MCBD17_040]|uniref:hypothetical protein n=1 Tax=Curtobacterium sp. MCBD17_040 TaxID=2175674 RepID=UPI000DA9BDAA|nr:hypothetical protein [Curtobacterium sp. MCBD17_040]WIB64378.1 hypothetical protein DEI94_04055 [Curtobacterium sp. MCBD17_040]
MNHIALAWRLFFGASLMFIIGGLIEMFGAHTPSLGWLFFGMAVVMFVTAWRIRRDRSRF